MGVVVLVLVGARRHATLLVVVRWTNKTFCVRRAEPPRSLFFQGGDLSTSFLSR
jgi:hypothetical protein